MKDRIEERGARWGMVRLRLPAASLAELEAEAAASGCSWGYVARARLAPAAETEEEPSGHEA